MVSPAAVPTVRDAGFCASASLICRNSVVPPAVMSNSSTNRPSSALSLPLPDSDPDSAKAASPFAVKRSGRPRPIKASFRASVWPPKIMVTSAPMATDAAVCVNDRFIEDWPPAVAVRLTPSNALFPGLSSSKSSGGGAPVPRA